MCGYYHKDLLHQVGELHRVTGLEWINTFSLSANPRLRKEKKIFFDDFRCWTCWEGSLKIKYEYSDIKSNVQIVFLACSTFSLSDPFEKNITKWDTLYEDRGGDPLYYIKYNRVNHEIRAVDRWSQANFQGRFYWWAIIISDG